MSQPDLEDKLAKSAAVHSLRAEQEVEAYLKENGWSTTHSFYYSDPDSGKDREMDVIGRRHWFRGRGDDLEGATISVVVECKSASGFHIVFPPLSDGRVYSLQEGWMGLAGPTRDKIYRTLAGGGMIVSQAKEVLRTLEAIAWPENVSRVASYRVSPAPALFNCSTFRETDTSKEKDLDNSVLWRAGQSVLSAVRSLENGYISTHIESLSRAMEHAESENRHPSPAAVEVLERSVKHVSFFHPAVVIDARLWALEQSGVKEVPYFRFLQHDAEGTISWWFDVVNREGFPDYMSKLTDYYHRWLLKVGADPWPRAKMSGTQPQDT